MVVVVVAEGRPTDSLYFFNLSLRTILCRTGYSPPASGLSPILALLLPSSVNVMHTLLLFRCVAL